MNQIKLVSIVFLVVLFANMSFAMALSTQTGGATPGVYVNLADPDEQVPAFLKSPEDQESLGSADHSNSNPNPPMVIDHQNMLTQPVGAPFNPYVQSGAQK